MNEYTHFINAFYSVGSPRRNLTGLLQQQEGGKPEIHAHVIIIFV